MITLTQIKEKAEQMGAEVDENHYPHESRKELQVAAPDGFLWAEAQSHHLVAEYYTYAKGDREEAYKDLLARMGNGFIPDPDPEFDNK